MGAKRTHHSFIHSLNIHSFTKYWLNINSYFGIYLTSLGTKQVFIKPWVARTGGSLWSSISISIWVIWGSVRGRGLPWVLQTRPEQDLLVSWIPLVLDSVWISFYSLPERWSSHSCLHTFSNKKLITSWGCLLLLLFIRDSWELPLVLNQMPFSSVTLTTQYYWTLAKCQELSAEECSGE